MNTEAERLWKKMREKQRCYELCETREEAQDAWNDYVKAMVAYATVLKEAKE